MTKPLNYFSAKNRPDIIEKLNQSSFDILVIGGGITGAGIALDATTRGLKVALIEMQDFASGTSGRSTKLIHGGLRYLKQLEFKLVAEVGTERKIVHQNAPHLTKPEPMLLPLVKQGSLGKFSARVGMTIYEWLAGVKKEEKHKVLSVDETLHTEPLLKKDNLLGGILFYEYRTDDARLTIEVMKEAVSRGATAINYMKAISFTYHNTSINGVVMEDVFTKKTHTISAKYIVNASGPWVDELNDLDKQTNEHKLQITKGVHLVVDWKKLPVKQSVYFDTPDKRMLFVIPREGKTYIGTTDTFYKGDIANPNITEEDKEYILTYCNNYFPNHQLQKTDIESGWAGLRPLVNKPGKGPSEISRKDELFISNSGLITIAGGKLTGYRKMAERVVNVIAKRIKDTEGKYISACITQNIQLSGGKIERLLSFSDFIKQHLIEGQRLGLSKEDIALLCSRYGSNMDTIYSIIQTLNTTNTSKLPIVLYAQLLYTIQYELCMTPSDFFIRRTGSLYFDMTTVKKYQKELILEMKQLLHWNEELTTMFSTELQKTLDELN